MREAPRQFKPENPASQELSRLEEIKSTILKEGVEDTDEARDIIRELIELGEMPTITVKKKYLEKILKEGGLNYHKTWIPGFNALIGTIGIPPYNIENDSDERITFKVTNAEGQLRPRFTGTDKRFHGVVHFSKNRIDLKDLQRTE